MDDMKANTSDIQKAEEFPVSFPINYPFQQEEEIHLREYLRVVLRRKWTVITFFLIVVTTVLIGTFMMKPIYRAAVSIKIDKENPNVLKFKDIYEIERVEDDYYQTQFKILKSRSLAKRVIRAMKLENNPEFAVVGNPAENSAATVSGNAVQQIDGDISPKVVDGFLASLTVEPQQKSRLVKVSFDSRSPELSAEVANDIAKSYIDYNIESKFDATQQARDWLEKQLQDMKGKVEKAEEALNSYASRNGIIFLTEGSSNEGKDAKGESIVTRKLNDLSTQLVQATSDRISKEALHREVQQGEAGSISPVLNNPLIQALKKDYATGEAEYSQLSKVYKPDYPKMVRLKEQLSQTASRIEAETGKLVSGIGKDYETALKRENSLKATLEKYKGEALNLNEKMVQYQILKREADTNREMYNGLLQRLKEVGVSASLTASNIQILDRAEIPRAPFKPKKRLNLILAAIVGLFGGVGLAFFVEYLDNTVKSPDDVEKKVTLPSLGIVPDLAKKGDRDLLPVITFDDKRSPLSEAYRSIGTYIQFSSAGRPPRTILVTSARQGEGKSTTVVNTAITLAHSYGRGVVIDSDLRRPQLHKIFDVDNSQGLSAFLAGHVEFGSSLIRKTKVSALDLIPSGIIPPNPSELLSSYRMRDLINGLFPLYSFIILDSPPILGLSDSLILSTMTDGVLMVARAGETPKEAALQAKKLLQGVNAKILGVVLNGVGASDLKYGSYSYYHSYYYGNGYDDERPKRKGRKKDKA